MEIQTLKNTIYKKDEALEKADAELREAKEAAVAAQVSTACRVRGCCRQRRRRAPAAAGGALKQHGLPPWHSLGV